MDVSVTRSPNSDRSHQLSISDRSVQNGEAASPIELRQQQNPISYTPPRWASRASTLDTTNLREHLINPRMSISRRRLVAITA